MTLRRGSFGAVRDATLWQSTPTWNDGASGSLYAGTSPGGYRVSALWFDLASIPAQAPVCTSTLRVSQAWKSSSSIVRLHEILVPWQEASVTWNALYQSWDPMAIGSFLAASGAGDRTVDVTALVQDWVDGIPNHGFLLEENPTVYTQLYSSEYTTPERRPRLEVCYVP